VCEKRVACGPHGSSPTPLLGYYTQRTRPADRVLEQLERDGIADLEIIERGALPQITAMKVDLAIIAQADESVALANHDLGNSPVRGFATRIIGP